MLTTRRAQLSPETFRLLRDLIYERCGIHFADSKRYLLESRLAGRLEERNCATYDDYYYFLKHDAFREQEMVVLFNKITINESSFFRDLPQLQAFEEGVLLPMLKNSAGSTRRLRLWSAACSTGEEPYTLAVMIRDQGARAHGWNVEIMASDLSESALDSAKRGIYGEYVVRNTPVRYLTQYFDNSGNTYTVKPEVKRMVRFLNLNLMDTKRMKLIRGMDVIFCRNVLIYFDDVAKKKAVESMYDSLNPGGYLFIGHSESLHSISRAFKLVTLERSVVYQKA